MRSSLVIFVDDLQSDRSPEADTLPCSAKDLNRVGFDTLPSSTPVATLATKKLCVDQIGIDTYAARKAINEPRSLLGHGIRRRSSNVT